MAQMSFSYAEMVGRNLGFVTAAEQEGIRAAAVFVCGVGGMGGACVQSLVRAGVGRLAIADTDRFEVSNLNRQVFATLPTVGEDKVAATARALREVNPKLELATFGVDWLTHLDAILPTYRIVVNGMDDLRAGIELYRRAREHGATVIDAYTSPLPSVTCVGPGDQRPEERLGFPTAGRALGDLSPQMLDACKLREAEYVMTHSSSARYIDLGIAAEVFAGARSRPSLAPMVIATGNLMAFEALGAILGRRSGAGPRGYFYDPWRGRVERPRPAPLAWLVRIFVRRELRRLLGGG
jgi:molybdopterin-synthase adenylyltransferase